LRSVIRSTKKKTQMNILKKISYLNEVHILCHVYLFAISHFDKSYKIRFEHREES